MSSVDFHASKTYIYLRRLSVELVWKSFSGRNNSQEPPVFSFSNMRFICLEESIKRVESFDLTGFRVIDIQKYNKNLLAIFFLHFRAVIMDL